MADQTNRAPGRLLTTDEAAALLRVSASTIRREVERGVLPAARIGRKGLLRIREQDVIALRDGQGPSA